ncbi:hypothetical protein D3C86_1638300 [compost metagenome]
MPEVRKEESALLLGAAEPEDFVSFILQEKVDEVTPRKGIAADDGDSTLGGHFELLLP